MLSFLKTRGRALLVLAMSVLAIGSFIAATLLGKLIFGWWAGVIVGVILMGLSVLLHFLGRRNKLGYFLSFLLNSVGAGFSASTYYTVSRVYCDLETLVAASLACVITLSILCIVLSLLPDKKHIFIAIFIIIEAVLLVLSVIFWIREGGEYCAFSFFSMLICVFYTGVCAITVDEEERRILRDISFGSFGVFILVSIIVILIISQGEACDGCDCCDCGDFGGSGKRKGKK